LLLVLLVLLLLPVLLVLMVLLLLWHLRTYFVRYYLAIRAQGTQSYFIPVKHDERFTTGISMADFCWINLCMVHPTLYLNLGHPYRRQLRKQYVKLEDQLSSCNLFRARVLRY
jgi:hypothetical protein